MLVSHRVPAPPLGAFIELLWLYESYAVPHARERLMPNGSMELVFVLSAPRAEAVVAGAYSQFAILDTSQPAFLLGVHFRPGGAYPFLGMPAGELHNLDVSLEDLWGADARDLHERLTAAPTPDEKFDLLEAALLARASTLQRDRAVAWAIRALHTRSVAEVTSAVGTSNRTFIDAFRRETGYTPKVFARVRRFQRLLRRIHGKHDVDWSDAALACGYYDQSHLIRDFRAFSGLSPSQYLAAQTEHFNHVPM